jgi:zinc/manganese transport system ATP-binding protein
LSDVSLSVQRGRTTVITGANGAGKSTLVEVLAGVLRADRGDVIRPGSPTAALVLQRPLVQDHLPLTVRDAVEIGCWARRPGFRVRRTPRSEVDATLAELELEDLARRPLDSLSGGQRQRTFLAQGLVQNADLLVLDEPTAGLDERSRRMVLAALASRVHAGTTVVHASHDPEVVERADLLVHLESGRRV